MVAIGPNSPGKRIGTKYLKNSKPRRLASSIMRLMVSSFSAKCCAAAGGGKFPHARPERQVLSSEYVLFENKARTLNHENKKVSWFKKTCKRMKHEKKNKKKVQYVECLERGSNSRPLDCSREL